MCAADGIEIHISRNAPLWKTRLYMPKCGLHIGDKPAFSQTMGISYVDKSVEIVESLASAAY